MFGRKKVFELFEPFAHYPGGTPSKSFTKKEIIEQLRNAVIIRRGFLGRIKAGIILRLTHPKSLPDPGIYFEKAKDGRFIVEGVYQDM